MKKLLFFLVTLFIPLSAGAEEESSLWNAVKVEMKTIWNSPHWDLIIPVNTWHNRLMYDDENIKEYNERPWGIGIAKRYVDEDGDVRQLYAMGFQDSHNDVEPFIGYAFIKEWGCDWRIGLGYTVGLTFREDSNYIPIPAILPILSLEYQRLSVQSTYIPGKYNKGNVLFTWLSWSFD